MFTVVDLLATLLVNSVTVLTNRETTPGIRNIGMPSRMESFVLSQPKRPDSIIPWLSANPPPIKRIMSQGTLLQSSHARIFSGPMKSLAGKMNSTILARTLTAPSPTVFS